MLKKILSIVISAAIAFSAALFLPADKSIVQPETAVAASQAELNNLLSVARSKLGYQYYGYCLKYVQDVFDDAGIVTQRQPDAWTAKGLWMTHTDRNPPAGAVVFFDQYFSADETFQQYGHIEISTGNGTIIGSGDASGQIKERAMNDFYWRHYIGWGWYPGADFSDANTPTGHIMSESEAAGQTIPDGDYWIFSALDPWVYVDPPGNEIIKENGKKIQVWRQYPNVYDVWTIEYQNNGFYKLMQKDSNMCMHIAGNSLKSGTDIHFWGRYGAEGEDFSIRKTALGYTLQARCGGFFMDVEGGSTANGTNIRVWEENGSRAQSFYFEIPTCKRYLKVV